MTELVITATVHDTPFAVDERQAKELESEIVRVIADYLEIEMTPDGSSGVNFAAPQVFLGVRAS